MIDFLFWDSEQTLDDMVSAFEEKTKEITGKTEVLTDGDERMVILHCMNYLAECLANKINKSVNNNLAIFADETNLIYKGIERNIYRLPAECATCEITFAVNPLAPEDVTIPQGTKVTSDGKVFFVTDEEITIPAGEEKAVSCTSATPGANANGYSEGQINILTDTIPYVDGVRNTSASSGGSDRESLDSFRNRVIFAPLKYGAGTKDKYIQTAGEVSAAIGNVVLTNVSNVISIYILCADGSLPSSELLEEVYEAESKDNVKGFTDELNVYPAERYGYEVEMTYKVAKSDQLSATAIQEDIEKAVNDYISETGKAMGTPINPEMIRKAAYMAGAASVEIVKPTYHEVLEYQVPYCTDIKLTYGGLL